MKILKSIGYCLPFILGGLAIFFTKEKPIEKYEETIVISKLIADKTAEYVENFIKDSNVVISDEKFSKIKLQKNEKIFKFTELSETKQNILKIMIYKQMLVKTDAFIKDNNIKTEKHNDLQKFQNKLELSIANSRNNIYKIYGTAIHPLDKDFLESLK